MGRDGKGMWMLNVDMEHTHTHAHNTHRGKKKEKFGCCALLRFVYASLPHLSLISFSRLAIFFREPDSESERKLPSFWQA